MVTQISTPRLRLSLILSNHPTRDVLWTSGPVSGKRKENTCWKLKILCDEMKI